MIRLTNALWDWEDTALRQPQRMKMGMGEASYLDDIVCLTYVILFRVAQDIEFGCDGINFCTENGCRNATIDEEPTEVCCCDGNL